MTAYLSLADIAFLLRWIGDHAHFHGQTPAAVSEPHPVRRRNGRIVMLGVNQ